MLETLKKKTKDIYVAPDPIMDFVPNVASSVSLKSLLIENPKTLILSLKIPLEGFVNLQGEDHISSPIMPAEDYSSRIKTCYDNFDNYAVNKSIEALTN